jgi:hypothetical protein
MAKIVRILRMRIAVDVISYIASPIAATPADPCRFIGFRPQGGFKSKGKVKQTFELNKRLINF